jgi:hypothetical protein
LTGRVTIPRHVLGDSRLGHRNAKLEQLTMNARRCRISHGQGKYRDSDDVVTLTSPARLKRVGREMRMLVEKLRSPDGSRSEFVEDYRTRSRYPDTP